MKTVKRWIGNTTFLLLLVLPAGLLVLAARPPELLRVAANYTAKVVCSNVFLAHRDPEEVLATDVQAPGNPLLGLMRVSVDRERGVVRAGLFGFIGGGLAMIRPEAGCAAIPDGRLDRAAAAHGWAAAPWRTPAGGYTVQYDAALRKVVEDDALAGPGMRAIVVVHDGRIVAERYAGGFDATTPQLGWSMTKSVIAGLIGMLVKDGRLALDQPAGWPLADPRAHIVIADLLAMSSGLEFNEGYGAVSDITRMLYLEPDMAAFARAKPLIRPVGSVWSYSSGSALILSRVLQDAVGTDISTWLRTRLFQPLEMSSAVMETDECGTVAGSSYLYATPRDWARYAVLLQQDGVWQGRELLPRGYVAMMASPVALSGGRYGRGMVWRWPTLDGTAGGNPEAVFGIPADAFWMSGHDGQYAAIIPSRGLVILRMGLTPARDGYRPEPLVGAVLAATRHAEAGS